jgi:protein-S-isoprenylcysteine O-methyltransferase Ste14
VLTVLRHLLAVLLLPVTMTVLVPYWLTTGFESIDTQWAARSSITLAMRALGAALVLAGVLLFSWCLTLFARVGRGTLAPWDPTQRFVAVGPYRYLRNPMITGVATVIAGEALITGSRVLTLWLVAFVAINFAYFVLVEEPGLERRFGEPYREYKARVPRWIPRRPTTS